MPTKTATEKQVEKDAIVARYQKDMMRYSRLAREKALRNNSDRRNRHMSFDEALHLVAGEDLQPPK